jgi:hypothetical protein
MSELNRMQAKQTGREAQMCPSHQMSWRHAAAASVARALRTGRKANLKERSHG